MELKTFFKPFQRLLRIIWKGFSQQKRSTSSETHEPGLLARYLIHRNYFNRQGNYIKPQAFMPPPNKKTSVFYINDLGEDKIWRIGEELVAHPQGKTLYGRGDISAVNIEKTKLKIDYDNIPERHANIIGWPEEKHEQKLLAQELAAAAELKILL